MSKRPISTGSEWNIASLRRYDEEIGKLAKDFGLDTYPNQLEIISAQHMMDAYASVGMPLGYYHWSFGKHFVDVEKNYRRGYMGLAYELVINSNPCIAYLLEENSMAMQALVIAHACYGHNSFFKGNYLFKMWTNADAIIDYLIFARNYITRCEEKYGIDEVENILDACHALMNYGVDRYRHPAKLSLQEEKIRQQNREHYLQTQVNELWRTIPHYQHRQTEERAKIFPEEPQENILYFLEKNAPLLKSWQREIIRIVRKIAQYFYPQRHTKVMNEGWATFWHYTLINALYDEGLVTDEFMLEILQNHTAVIAQPAFDSQMFNGINPYTLGYNIFSDIKRVCQSPTEEDKLWLPHLLNQDWQTALLHAMQDFKDESFILQYLSPKVIGDMKLFALLNEDQAMEVRVSAIHNQRGYQHIRQTLARQYDLSYQDPDIQVYKVDIEGDRSLTLRYLQQDARPLHDDASDVIRYLYQLWKFPVRLETVNTDDQIVETRCYPVREGDKAV
jgi:stage V sporulation protein R